MPLNRRYALAGFIILTLGLLVFCAFALIKAETQRQEIRFAGYVHDVSGIVRNQLDTNDAVLAGFSAFLQAVDQSDADSAARYAAAVSAAYPHIYMLEVARAVPTAEQADFQALLRRTWNPDFKLKQFPDVGEQAKAPYTALKETWPVLFMYPPLPQATEIYGVRLETVPHLTSALIKSRTTAKAVASPLFSMYEGGSAYILLRTVIRPERREQQALPNFFGSTMVAMLVISADSLLKAINEGNVDPSIGIRAQLKADPDAESTVLSIPIREAGWIDLMLFPRFKQQVEIGSASQPMTLLYERQLRLEDVLGPETSIILLVLVALGLLTPMAIMRHFKAIHKAEAEHARSVYLANHDVLTGLANRYLLTQRFEHALAQYINRSIPFAVLLIDLDDFKEINDTDGHVVGDQALQIIASRMTQASRSSDTVARYGGDEFVVLIADSVSRQAVEDEVTKIFQAIQEPIALETSTVSLSCSMGVSFCPGHGRDIDTLIKAADHAMYEIKQSGKSGIAFARSKSHEYQAF